MATITIRDLDAETNARLRVRAARHGRSTEEEARTLPRVAVRRDLGVAVNLADAIHSRFGPLGEVEFRLPAREPMRNH